MEELDNILGENDTNETSSVDTTVSTNSQVPDAEIQAKSQELKNLEIAKQKALEELQKIRNEKKQLKSSNYQDDEEMPRIDMTDPSAQAWDNHIRQSVNPIASEIEKEKEEIFRYAFDEFIANNPFIANSPERIKNLVETYEAIKRNTGRTREGVLSDLKRAYGAEFSDDLISQANVMRTSKAQADAIFSDPAVTRGAGTYRTDDDIVPKYSESDKQILAKWNMSPQEHAATIKEISQKGL